MQGVKGENRGKECGRGKKGGERDRGVVATSSAKNHEYMHKQKGFQRDSSKEQDFFKKNEVGGEGEGRVRRIYHGDARGRQFRRAPGKGGEGTEKCSRKERAWNFSSMRNSGRVSEGGETKIRKPL